MVVKRGRGRLFGRRRKTVRFLLQKQLIENRNSGLLSDSAYLHLAKDAKEPFFAGACSLTRECRLFFCVRFLSLPWGGADACSRFVCGSRVGRRIRPACSPCGSEPFVVGGIPSFPPQPLPRTRFFIFFAAQYFSRAYPLPFFRRSAHLFFHVSSGQPVACLFGGCGISAPAV